MILIARNIFAAATIFVTMDTQTSQGPMVLLTRLSRQVYRLTTEARLGMRLKHFVLLNHVRDEAASQKGLAETLCMDANNLVLLLNEVEALGFAQRRRDPADRRRHLVEITPAGRRALERGYRAMESVEDDVLGALDDEQRAQLTRLLALAADGQPGA